MICCRIINVTINTSEILINCIFYKNFFVHNLWCNMCGQASGLIRRGLISHAWTSSSIMYSIFRCHTGNSHCTCFNSRCHMDGCWCRTTARSSHSCYLYNTFRRSFLPQDYQHYIDCFCFMYYYCHQRCYEPFPFQSTAVATSTRTTVASCNHCCCFSVCSSR